MIVDFIPCCFFKKKKQSYLGLLVGTQQYSLVYLIDSCTARCNSIIAAFVELDVSLPKQNI